MSSKVVVAGAAGGGAVGAASAVALTSAALGSIGFTASGVAAGSVAAAIQSIIGNVAAGSMFAAAQTAGATGSVVAGFGVVGTVVIVAGVAVVVAALSGLTTYGIYRGVQHSYYTDVIKAKSKRDALALLKVWDAQSNEMKQILLPVLEKHLVSLKRVWSGLKPILEKDFKWFEPVVGDGQFRYTMKGKEAETKMPDLTGLADHINNICRSEEQVLVEAAITILDLWQQLLDMRVSHEDEKERTGAKEQLVLVLPILAGVLVLLKRKWSKLKQKLQETYDWDEPWIGDGTFVQLKESKKTGKEPEELPMLSGLREDVLALCKFDEF